MRNAEKTLSEEELRCLNITIDETLWAYEDALNAGAGSLYEPHESLPVTLMDQGFDVWIHGYRGTKYQRGHATLNSDDAAYWGDWAHPEMATEDIKAEIDYILEATNRESLSYIGYSMGSMQMYYNMAMAAEDNNLARTIYKVDRFLSVAPCAWLDKFNPATATPEDVQLYLDFYDSYNLPYMYGEGSDATQDTQLQCLSEYDWVWFGD